MYGNDSKNPDGPSAAADIAGCETPAHGNLSMKGTESPEILHPKAPKPAASNARKFTFEGLSPLNTPSASQDSDEKQLTGGEVRCEDFGQDIRVDDPTERRESTNFEQKEPEENLTKQTEAESETAKNDSDARSQRQHKSSRLFVNPLASAADNDEDSERSTPFDEDPITPRTPTATVSPGSTPKRDRPSLKVEDGIQETMNALLSDLTHSATNDDEEDKRTTNATAQAIRRSQEQSKEQHVFPVHEEATEHRDEAHEDQPESSSLALAPSDELENRSTQPPDGWDSCGGNIEKMHLFDMRWCSDP